VFRKGGWIYNGISDHGKPPCNKHCSNSNVRIWSNLYWVREDQCKYKQNGNKRPNQCVVRLLSFVIRNTIIFVHFVKGEKDRKDADWKNDYHRTVVFRWSFKHDFWLFTRTNFFRRFCHFVVGFLFRLPRWRCPFLCDGTAVAPCGTNLHLETGGVKYHLRSSLLIFDCNESRLCFPHVIFCVFSCLFTLHHTVSTCCETPLPRTSRTCGPWYPILWEYIIILVSSFAVLSFYYLTVRVGR